VHKTLRYGYHKMSVLLIIRVTELRWKTRVWHVRCTQERYEISVHVLGGKIKRRSNN
jgi:hypothetical protein